MTPTQEQERIIEAAHSTPDNLLISALAGAAKTTTLVLIAEALPKVSILCLAFNRRIATEMQERLPPNCQAMTLNSLGHRVWGQAIGKRLRIDARKGYGILKQLVDDLSQSDKNEVYKDFADTLRAIEFGKACGFVPDGKYTNAKRLLDDEGFFNHLEEEPTALQFDLIRRASLESLRQAWEGACDFDDQILLPTIFSASFPQYPLVLIDEAQDLSSLNHATLRKLAKKRLIAVGDECQSIYGFRGAHEDSMNLLEESFSMRKLTLSISFRCPQSIVNEARWRAPTMRWPSWALAGEVRSLAKWSITDLPEAATILCRNNAPIFNMAIQLLKNGRYPKIVGNDLGKNLIKTLTKLGPTSMPVAQVMQVIEKWEKGKLAKSRSPKKVQDQAECLRIFARQGENLGDAIAYAQHIMEASGPILLSTIHKAKGLEWDNVILLDKHLINMEEQQDRNLLYVGQTRTKETLWYVTTEGFNGLRGL